MMTSAEIRQQFLDFFKSKGHIIVPSAPIVVKNDPTLLFTNAGMNQFKDYFLGNKPAPYNRAADTQKCLRVSGKHNDLEEVGVDTYHHTMFEMLGNWSFGDYFKKDAIAWSWELLTDVYKLDKDRLYVTIFEGDAKENLPKDEEAYNEWKKCIAADRILLGNKKDNFWEMGDTGPCGPCSEIHVDCRSDEERKAVAGSTLVNNDHPQVIEIWNNVFIQFNRKKDGSLEPLPAQHVDTGMGFERLARVIQGKQSNYDTDIFTGTIAATEKITNKKYTNDDTKEAVAFRVIADHIRAISFTIADGQLPSNTGAGYVIRRILRRAVRYYYSYLDYKQPLLHQLLPIIAKQFETVFPELNQQLDFVSKVVKEEEDAFMKTLGKGIERFERNINSQLETQLRIKKFFERNYIEILVDFNGFDNVIKIKSILDLYLPKYNIGIELYNSSKANINISDRLNQLTSSFGCKVALVAIEDIITGKVNFEYFEKLIGGKLDPQNNELRKIDGKTAFELIDTFGFPIDLTQLMANEIGWAVDMVGYEKELKIQKDRSRAATSLETEDWIIVNDISSSKFVGYDAHETKSKVVKYRTVKNKGKELFQIVLNKTPFYPESGGQVGDTGKLKFSDSEISIIDTKRENDLIVHFAEIIPINLDGEIIAAVNGNRRTRITTHHSATHLMHSALRKVLGSHVAQKGSLVNEDHLRFDFSHFAKMTDSEISAVEKIVNEKIRENIIVEIEEMKKDDAVAMGAMALFGEKYGEIVRVVIMDKSYSVELCGGTHVKRTGELSLFKIKSESAVAAGVRRVEAICGIVIEAYVEERINLIDSISEVLKSPKDIQKSIENLQIENVSLKKHIEALEARQLVIIRNELLQKDEIINNVTFIGDIVEVSSADNLKKLCFDLKSKLNDYVAVLCCNIDGKPFVAVGISDTVVAAKNLDAGKIIKEHIAPLIKGGGGGQKNLATAGGQDVSGLKAVIEKVKNLL